MVDDIFRENNRRLLERAASKILFETYENARKYLQGLGGEVVGGGVCFYNLFIRKNRDCIITRTICKDNRECLSDGVLIK